MPKLFARIPFWIWPLFGLICLILAVPGFLAIEERKVRAAALAGSAPALIDLEEFNPSLHAGLADEVNIFAQTSPDYRFLVDGAGLTGGSGYVVPLFSAVAGPKEKQVAHVLIVRDLEQFEPWLTENVTGTARMGDLYEINGEIVDGRGYTAAIRLTLQDAGLEQVDPLVIVSPFVAGREAGFMQLQFSTYGNPFVLAASGLWMIWFGFVVWSRGKALKKNVGRRMGEIGDIATSEDNVNLSRLKRTSNKLAAGKAAKEDDAGDFRDGSVITPAE